ERPLLSRLVVHDAELLVVVSPRLHARPHRRLRRIPLRVRGAVRTSMRVLLVGLAVACAGACSDRPQLPPIGQVILYVTTDTLLPGPPGDATAPPGLFDRLSIEIFP